MDRQLTAAQVQELQAAQAMGDYTGMYVKIALWTGSVADISRTSASGYKQTFKN